MLPEGKLVSELDAEQPIFAVVARETDVEKLLQAAGAGPNGGWTSADADAATFRFTLGRVP